MACTESFFQLFFFTYGLSIADNDFLELEQVKFAAHFLNSYDERWSEIYELHYLNKLIHGDYYCIDWVKLHEFNQLVQVKFREYNQYRWAVNRTAIYEFLH
jgi:hypothetical protein